MTCWFSAPSAAIRFLAMTSSVMSRADVAWPCIRAYVPRAESSLPDGAPHRRGLGRRKHGHFSGRTSGARQRPRRPASRNYRRDQRMPAPTSVRSKAGPTARMRASKPAWKLSTSGNSKLSSPTSGESTAFTASNAFTRSEPLFPHLYSRPVWPEHRPTLAALQRIHWKHAEIAAIVSLLGFALAGCKTKPKVDYTGLDQSGMWSTNLAQVRR